MERNLAILKNEELRQIIKEEERRLINGIDQGLSFNSLKTIRLEIRQLQNELYNREWANTGKGALIGHLRLAED